MIEEPTDEDLKRHGWAPGGYLIHCIDCQAEDRSSDEWGDTTAAKRSTCCREHAVKRWKDNPNPEPKHPTKLSIPIQGPQDGWPRTADGYLVRPGTTVRAHRCTSVVRKVYDGGEYGHCVELENADGPQGWAALKDCWFVY
jgi:hypothetical protein